MGLTGMIIVDDGTDVPLGLPRTFGIDDLPLILQDRSFASDGSIEYETDGLDIVYGARGDTVIVNGAIAPVAKVPPGLVRLRLLNAANAQNFVLRFSDQRTFHVIASDGGFLPAPVAVSKLRISPAERFEVLVDFANGKAVTLETGPDEEMGIFGRLAPDGSADYVPVMRFEPTATKPLVKEMPTRLVELSAASQAPAVRQRQFIVNSGLCMERTRAGEHAGMVALTGINGKPFDMDRIDVETKLGTSEVSVRVLHAAVGGINESDVTLARASNAMIIGFNVRANPQAREMARRDGVDIRYYSIIYNVVDDVKAALSGLLSPTLREKLLGNATILEIFNITKVGKVAGCRVTDGVVRRGAKVRLLRDDVVIHEGSLKTLKHFKDEVREVKAGTECGMAFENYDNIQTGDVIECFELEEVARVL